MYLLGGGVLTCTSSAPIRYLFKLDTFASFNIVERRRICFGFRLDLNFSPRFCSSGEQRKMDKLLEM